MKIPNFPRLNMGDFSDMPDWMRPFIDALNPILETIVSALQSNISLTDNMNGEYRTVLIEDDTEYEISTDVEGVVKDVYVSHSEYYDYPLLAWKQKPEGSILFRVAFDTAPSAAVNVTLRIVGE